MLHTKMKETNLDFDQKYTSELEALRVANKLEVKEITKYLTISTDRYIGWENNNEEIPNYDNIFSQIQDLIEDIVDKKGQELRVYPRMEIYCGELMTELKALRERNNLTALSIYSKLGLTAGQYSIRENGKRKFTIEEYEQFYYDVNHAIEEVMQDRIETIHMLPQRTLLDEEDEGDEELVFMPVTDAVIEQAIEKLKGGQTLIRVSIDLGVDSVVLDRRFNEKARELPFLQAMLDNSKFDVWSQIS